ncbi:AraC family transcriptional regulator [Pelagicoccus sp. SDUM812002]|uniref:AraC family transcriptional regulator n=1 Tax=Pelagicoccus sp. SDUM812002 TaxID=3041266 RepID=UPI00280EE601|nr:AraC family transcriptional regulator [Pelagicoccus sp. SDUM812002]MDQ8184207.1 AraC family transcriptional regulator [Pelagicoccus sp. SDUM812002]
MSPVESLFHQLDPTSSINRIFDVMPRTMFFVKDADLRIVMSNQEFAQHCGFCSAEQLHGLSDDAIFPAYMARKFHRDDLVVLENAEPLTNLVELFPTREGLPEWFTTHKLPLCDISGKAIGVCGVVQSYERILSHAKDPIYQLVRYIRENYANPISIPELARKIGLSQRQLERRFNSVFRVSPRRYIVRLRLIIASDRLRESDMPITEIAYECGFYDHSSFIRHFRSTFGTTPLKFRKRFRRELTKVTSSLPHGALQSHQGDSGNPNHNSPI